MKWVADLLTKWAVRRLWVCRLGYGWCVLAAGHPGWCEVQGGPQDPANDEWRLATPPL